MKYGDEITKGETVPKSMRIPVDLVMRIEQIAKKERRSFSAQAIVYLEDQLRKAEEEVSA